ncbi:hypothetical protein NQ318_001547 [Aromia moschata]|uniref:Uncharacterized protein n=1 Tax=Aromia moschata TaxID=1265417 RepID=A0AAV8YA48_9CUCU|nr:hypothetical protein NQ318_001547 [Aromia moschata]
MVPVSRGVTGHTEKPKIEANVYKSSASLPTTTESPRQKGPQARVSGKDGAPSTKRRWVPPSTLRNQDALTPESRNDLVFRRVRGILNKLTPEKFKKLSDDLLRIELQSSVILKGVIILIFEKKTRTKETELVRYHGLIFVRNQKAL